MTLTAAWDPAAGSPPTRREIDIAIREVAAVYGLDPMLLTAVMSVESRFNPRAVSPKGAQGLMQLMPRTAADLGVTTILNPWENLEGGARYLRERLDVFRGDLTLALAAYNAGDGAVRRHGGIPQYPETQRYVADVLGRYRALKGTAPVQPAAARPAGDAPKAPTPTPGSAAVVIEIREDFVDTTKSAASNTLGLVALRKGRLEEAQTHFESALALDPDNPRILDNLGRVRQLQGDLRAAADHFRRAWDRDPARVETALNLMLVSAQLGQYREARALLAQTKPAGEHLPAWHLNAATLLDVEGDRARAAHHYRRFLELTVDEGSPVRARVVERLADLASR